MKKVLFICLGNICRSPAAEGILQGILKANGREDVYVDSAGTSAYHQGNKADPRMREHGTKRGHELLSLSRPLDKGDFDEFDYLVCMDNSNYANTLALAPSESYHSKVYRMCEFNEKFDDQEVPDPYYGGDQGFIHVFELLEHSCMTFFNQKLSKLTATKTIKS